MLWSLGALAGWALAVAISLTLFRDGGRHGSLARLRGCAVTDPTVLSGDGLANLALFAPAAFWAVLAIGRPGRVAAAIAAVSLAVEGLQAVESVGVCDSSDALLNALGGLVAALAAAPSRGDAQSRTTPCQDRTRAADPADRGRPGRPRGTGDRVAAPGP